MTLDLGPPVDAYCGGFGRLHKGLRFESAVLHDGRPFVVDADVDVAEWADHYGVALRMHEHEWTRQLTVCSRERHMDPATARNVTRILAKMAVCRHPWDPAPDPGDEPTVFEALPAEPIVKRNVVWGTGIRPGVTSTERF